jgi:hypothetical protein
MAGIYLISKIPSPNRSYQTDRKMTLLHQTHRFRSHLAVLVMVCVCSAVALFTVRYHDVISFTDDNLITYAHLMKFPERFSGDIVSLYGTASTWGTIFNWGPGLLWRDLNISPWFMYIMLTWAQAVVMGFASYIFITRVTQNAILGFIGMLFVFAAQPTRWNLANYGTLFPQLYAGDFVNYLCLLALAALIQNRGRVVLAILFISSFIHPSVTLYYCGIIGLYAVWDIRTKRNTQQGLFLLGLALIVAITIAPRFLIKTETPGDVAPSVILANLKLNIHFALNQHDSPQFFTFVMWMVLVAFSVRYWRRLPPRVVQLWVCTLIGATLLVLSQVAGLVLNVPTLIQLVGARSTQILTLVSLPLVLFYLWNLLERNDWLAVWLLLTFLLAATIVPYGAFGGFLLAFLFYDLAYGFVFVRKLRLTSRMRFAARAAAFMFSLVWLLVLTLGTLSPKLIVLIALIGVGYSVVSKLDMKWKYPFPEQRLAALLMAGVGIFALGVLHTLYSKAAELGTEHVQAMYDVQRWAAENTSTTDLFAGIETAWRAESVRPYLPLVPQNWFVYALDSRLLAYQENIAQVYGVSYAQFSTFNVTREFYHFSPAQFQKLNRTFGVRYVIYRNQYGSLPFRAAYRNAYFTLYDIGEDEPALFQSDQKVG